jgi:hypothetical protein
MTMRAACIPSPREPARKTVSTGLARHLADHGSSTLDPPIPLTGGEARAIAPLRWHCALPKGAKCRQRSRAALEK